MRIRAVGRPIPGVVAAQFTPELAAAEARRAWAPYQGGTVTELYLRTDESSAVLMLECEDLSAAREVLASLPLVAAGLIEFEVLPLRAYSGFGRLCAPGVLPSERP
jgi:hypothetical protein